MVNDNKNHHYILIRNFSRLVSKRYKSYNGRLCFCPYWLHGCTSQLVIDDHQERCKIHGAQRIWLPEKNGKNDTVMKMIQVFIIADSFFLSAFSAFLIDTNFHKELLHCFQLLYNASSHILFILIHIISNSVKF